MPVRFLLTALLLCAFADGSSAEGLGAKDLDAPAGALSCSGCHPASATVQSPAPRIVGRNAEEMIAALADFKHGTRPATVMDRVAKGFTDDELRAIASWYAARKD